MKIEIYSDGSATISTKPGGYGWVLVVDGQKHSEGYGHIPLATNNDAELEGAIQGLVAVFKYLRTPEAAEQLYVTDISRQVAPEITLVSDSQIILNWASGAHKFKQKAKLDKYNQLRALVDRMQVQTRWVEGHTGDEHNERCDKLANIGRKNQEIEVKKQAGITSKIGKKKDGVTSFWYKGILKVIDFQNNIVEDYDSDLHGKRESKIQIN